MWCLSYCFLRVLMHAARTNEYMFWSLEAGTDGKCSVITETVTASGWP